MKSGKEPPIKCGTPCDLDFGCFRVFSSQFWVRVTPAKSEHPEIWQSASILDTFSVLLGKTLSVFLQDFSARERERETDERREREKERGDRQKKKNSDRETRDKKRRGAAMKVFFEGFHFFGSHLNCVSFQNLVFDSDCASHAAAFLQQLRPAQKGVPHNGRFSSALAQLNPACASLISWRKQPAQVRSPLVSSAPQVFSWHHGSVLDERRSGVCLFLFRVNGVMRYVMLSKLKLLLILLLCPLPEANNFTIF